MIRVTKLNGQSIIINLELIESIEETPDTIITLTTGKKMVVLDKTNEIIANVIRFKKQTEMNLKR
ncbi:MAG: flagellar FlbD family protein [Chitinophagales bacterium]